MKKITLCILMCLSSLNVLAAGLVPNSYLVFAWGGMPHGGGSDEAGYLITSNLALSTSTTTSNPIAGLVIFADNGEVMLDMENEALQDELEMIEISIEEGQELTDLQKAIIHIGQQNNQF